MLSFILCSQVEGISKAGDTGSPQAQEFDNMLQVTHYYSCRAASLQHKSLVNNNISIISKEKIFINDCNRFEDDLLDFNELITVSGSHYLLQIGLKQ